MEFVLNVFTSHSEFYNSFVAERFVKGTIGFVGADEVVSRVDYLFVELENRIVFFAEVVRDLFAVRVEADTDERVVFGN